MYCIINATPFTVNFVNYVSFCIHTITLRSLILFQSDSFKFIVVFSKKTTEAMTSLIMRRLNLKDNQKAFV